MTIVDHVHRPSRRARPVRVALIVVTALIAVAAGLSQLLLPMFAAERMRGRLDRYGRVYSTTIRAWPAVRLLWGDADSAKVRAGDLSLTPGALAELLWESRGIASLEATAKQVTLVQGPLSPQVPLLEVASRKQGSHFRSTATLSQPAIDATAPPGVRVSFQPAAGGVQVRLTGALFGGMPSFDGYLTAIGGRLVVEPVGDGLLVPVSITVFSDPHLDVEAVALQPESVGADAYRLALKARLV